MAYAGPQTGNSTSVAFGTTSSLDALQIISATWDGISIADILTSHLGTTGYHTYVPADLKEGGTVSVEFYIDADIMPEPFTGTETVTFTQPITDGTNSTAGTVAASMYLNNVSWAQVNDDVMKGTYTLKVADDITFTDSSV